MTVFADRVEAGRLLAAKVAALGVSDPVVLALPRGGVPVAAEVARALAAPLDLLLVRKIGVPWQPELAVAAIVDGAEPQLVIDEPVLRDTGLARSVIDDEARRQLREIERRRITYLQGRAPIAVEGRTAIVVDDGIATGTTMRAALRGLRRRRPAHLVLAVPVAPAETIAALQAEVDRIVCLAQPDPFYAIGAFYRDFHQLDDQEVIDLLAAADRLGPAGSGPR
jgi:putative phosphoribosyl transferase